MKNKIFLSLAAAGLVLMALLTGCQEAPPSSISSSTPQATAVPTEEPTSSPTPEATATPEPTSDQDFAQLFTQHNLVDSKIKEDLRFASSANAIGKVYKEANQNWERIINSVSQAAMEVLPSDASKTLQEEVDSWRDSIEGQIDEIYTDLEEDMDSQIDAAKEVMELYRSMALKVSEVYYRQTGELPDFEEALADKAMG